LGNTGGGFFEMDCILLKTGCQSKLESFEKYLSLSDYTDLEK